MRAVGVTLGSLIGLGLILFINPIIGVIFGAFAGWVIELCFGGFIVHGLNTIFDTARFVPSDLPAICATLAVIGTYFKATLSKN